MKLYKNNNNQKLQIESVWEIIRHRLMILKRKSLTEMAVNSCGKRSWGVRLWDKIDPGEHHFCSTNHVPFQTFPVEVGFHRCLHWHDVQKSNPLISWHLSRKEEVSIFEKCCVFENSKNNCTAVKNCNRDLVQFNPE